MTLLDTKKVGSQHSRVVVDEFVKKNTSRPYKSHLSHVYYAGRSGVNGCREAELSKIRASGAPSPLAGD